MLARFERHQAASYGAAAVPSKTMCRQTLTTPDGPERRRRFYLAVARSKAWTRRFCAKPRKKNQARSGTNLISSHGHRAEFGADRTLRRRGSCTKLPAEICSGAQIAVGNHAVDCGPCFLLVRM